jgi:hypothetical protein
MTQVRFLALYDDGSRLTFRSTIFVMGRRMDALLGGRGGPKSGGGQDGRPFTYHA